MGGVRITVNDRDFRSALREAERRGANMRVMWDRVGNEGLEIARENFRSQGRPRKWKSWTRSYGNWRSKKAPGKILNLSGRLLNSLSKGDADNLFSTNRRGAEVGTKTPYAETQQEGARTRPHVIKPKAGKALRWAGSSGTIQYAKSVKHPGSKIPARPFLVIPDSQVPRLTKIIEDYMAAPWR